MDYRHYRGDLPELPHWLAKRIYLLKYIGGILMASVPVIGWLTVLKIMRITFLWYLYGNLATLFGIVFAIVGMVYDNPLDRSD